MALLTKSSSASRTNRSTFTAVEQIADAMRLVLPQPALAAQFTWERTARETIAVYERVLAAGSGER